MLPHVIRQLTSLGLLMAAAFVAASALWRALRRAEEGYEDDVGFRFGRRAGR